VSTLSKYSNPIVAFFGILIAFLLRLTYRTRLKYELFDRRYEQFIFIKDFLGSIIRNGNVDKDEFYTFLIGTKSFRYIFDKKIDDHFKHKIMLKAVELDCSVSEYQGLHNGYERQNNIRKQRDLQKRLHQEFENLENLFSPYLGSPEYQLTYCKNSNKML